MLAWPATTPLEVVYAGDYRTLSGCQIKTARGPNHDYDWETHTWRINLQEPAIFSRHDAGETMIWIADVLTVTMAWALGRMPRPLALRIGHWLGAAIHLVYDRKNSIIRTNLKRAGVEDPAPLTPEAWHHMWRTFIEICWMMNRSPAASLEGVEIHGMEEVRRVAARGSGILLVSAHAANWELVSMALSNEGIAPMAVIARKLRTRNAERKQILFRERAGIRTLVRGEKGSSIAAYRLLARGGILGVMMDRLSSGRRITVPFLGNATRMPLGPPELAWRSGAAVILGMAERLPEGGTVIRYTELPTAGVESAVEMAKVIATGLEEELRTRPEQWLWIARRQPEWNGEYTITDR
jgi:KDO2-lipid IV(A) lauroyltransferase